jgi:GDP-4-dehydro-6-deoxy-D-mannose reductase
MRHLVTGANGFCGRHLMEILRGQPGADVLGIGRSEAPGLGATADLCDAEAVRGILEKWKPERIYHLAGSCSEEWEKAFSSNVETTRVLLEAVRSLELRCRVLLVGSAAEYGRVPPVPLTEETPRNPLSTYALTKSMQTELMGFFHRRFGLHLVMARAFNLHGEGSPTTLFPGHVAREIDKVKSGEQSKIHVRDLSASRDYLPVADAMRAYIRILEHGEPGQVYHVASGNPVRMSDFLLELLRPHGLGLGDVETLPSPPGSKPDIPCVFADIGKLAALVTKSGNRLLSQLPKPFEI